MNAEATRLNALTEQIIGAAIDVSMALGPGLLESAYQSCLAYELVKRGLSIERQKPLPLTYDNVKLDCAYRMDLVVEGSVVVEVKSVAQINRVHEAQMISYLKIAALPVGLVLNFNVKNLATHGIRRKVNNFPDCVSGIERESQSLSGRAAAVSAISAVKRIVDPISAVAAISAVKRIVNPIFRDLCDLRDKTECGAQSPRSLRSPR